MTNVENIESNEDSETEPATYFWDEKPKRRRGLIEQGFTGIALFVTAFAVFMPCNYISVFGGPMFGLFVAGFLSHVGIVHESQYYSASYLIQDIFSAIIFGFIGGCIISLIDGRHRGIWGPLRSLVFLSFLFFTVWGTWMIALLKPNDVFYYVRPPSWTHLLQCATWTFLGYYAFNWRRDRLEKRRMRASSAG